MSLTLPISHLDVDVHGDRGVVRVDLFRMEFELCPRTDTLVDDAFRESMNERIRRIRCWCWRWHWMLMLMLMSILTL